MRQVGWFSPGIPVSSNNKTDRHDIAEMLWKVMLNTITLTLLSAVTHQEYWIILTFRHFLLFSPSLGLALSFSLITIVLFAICVL